MGHAAQEFSGSTADSSTNPFVTKTKGRRSGAAMNWAKSPSAISSAEDIKRRRGETSHRVGLAAEDAVRRRYIAEGTPVLAQRWRCPYGEIDLIVRDGDYLVFVEVKRRSRPIEDDPVHPKQWRRLEDAAQAYMIKAQTGDALMRFDLAIVGAGGLIEVTRNARC